MTLNIGLVDTGFISEYHFNGFAASPQSKVVGVARTWREGDRASQQQKLNDFAACHGIKAYVSFEEMASSPEIDAVVVSSVNPYHFGQIKFALEHGKHVLAEKPMVKTEAELEQLVKLAAAAKRCLVPAHNFAYRGAVLQAKELIISGKLGKIQYGSFTQSFLCSALADGSWRSKHETAWGGALIDSGTHLVYQTLQLVGKPVAVQAMAARNVFAMDDEDIASAQLQYADGAIVHVMQNWGSTFGDDIEGIRLVGALGRIKISDALYFNGEKLSGDTGYADSFANQARTFTACVLEGKDPASTLEDARWTLRIIDGAYESIRSGRTIQL